MAVSNKPWGTISESDYGDANEFCSVCLIDLNQEGRPKVKELCKLPVKEPGGAYNRNAIHAAAAALAGARGGVKAPASAKRKAARELVYLYRRLLEEEPPEAIVRLAK
ncbi:MAG: hypothetical protein H5T71_03835 [Chloroflexi bacterium]|nr:hypothetical protein [Chloroflexota bacterium]